MKDKNNKKDLCHTKGEAYYWHTLKEPHWVLSEVQDPTELQSALGTHWMQELAVVFVIQKHVLHFLLISQIKTVVARATLNGIR